MWNMVGFRKSCNAVALFSLLSGCTTLTDCKYELGQKVRTKQAWHEFDGCNDRCFTLDYSCGWKQGYYDVLTGGDGRPPVVPPKKYWKPPVFTEHDPSRVNDWSGRRRLCQMPAGSPLCANVPARLCPLVTLFDGGFVGSCLLPNGTCFWEIIGGGFSGNSSTVRRTGEFWRRHFE